MTRFEEGIDLGVPEAGRGGGGQVSRRSLMAGVVIGAVGAALLPATRTLITDVAAAPKTESGACPAQAVASPVADAPQVLIENFTFSPDARTVPVGTTVTWLNKDDIPHTVTSDDKTTFASSLLDTDDTFSYEFTTAGTFPYFCSVHPMMTAKVVVQ
jgi:plastocyanin